VGMDYIPEQSAIYLADSMALLPRIRPGSVRLCLTDPPYNISRKNNLDTLKRRGFEFSWDGEFDQLSWLKLVDPAIMPGGSIVIWNSWQVLGYVSAALTSMGYSVKRKLEWIKGNPMPLNPDRSFVQSSESALWAVKPGAKWAFNRGAGKHYERCEFHYASPRSKHPTKKPTGLFQELITILSHPGELVLDPFAGSGTMAVAATRTGRRHISFEKDAAYFALAAASLAKEIGSANLSTLGSPPLQETATLQGVGDDDISAIQLPIAQDD